MKRLFLMDENNYDESLPELRREAVRGIVTVDGKLLFIKDSQGELKIPGGGRENGESDIQTLIREVREETGFHVIPETVEPFGYIEEKRLSLREPMIWHQFSYLYFCDVGREREECSFSDNEKSLGMHFCMYKLEEAIETSKRALDAQGGQAWKSREYKTLLLIKEHYEKRKK